MCWQIKYTKLVLLIASLSSITLILFQMGKFMELIINCFIFAVLYLDICKAVFKSKCDTLTTNCVTLFAYQK